MVASVTKRLSIWLLWIGLDWICLTTTHVLRDILAVLPTLSSLAAPLLSWQLMVPSVMTKLSNWQSFVFSAWLMLYCVLSCVCSCLVMVYFTHILQGYLTGTGAIIPWGQCINSEEHHSIEKYYNQNTTKQNKTMCIVYGMYRKTSNISRTLVSNKIVDHSDVDGASPVSAAPTTSSFST